MKSLKYCKWCKGNKSIYAFSPGQSKCIDCRRLEQEEKKFKYPIEGFQCMLKPLTYGEVICQEFEKYFNKEISYKDLFSSSRKREVVYARHISMIYRNKIMMESQSVAAGYYADRDHATLIAGQKTANNLYDTDKMYQEVIKKIEQRLDIKLISI
jgi:hypothetical protein